MRAWRRWNSTRSRAHPLLVEGPCALTGGVFLPTGRSYDQRADLTSRFIKAPTRLIAYLSQTKPKDQNLSVCWVSDPQILRRRQNPLPFASRVHRELTLLNLLIAASDAGTRASPQALKEKEYRHTRRRRTWQETAT
jgi:hypothetical protein